MTGMDCWWCWTRRRTSIWARRRSSPRPRRRRAAPWWRNSISRRWQAWWAAPRWWATLKGSDTFLGTKAGLAGDTIAGLTANDKIDVTDLAPLTGVNFTQTAAGQGTLSLGFGRSLTLTGAFNPSHFHIATDGHAGSFVTYG